MDLYKVTNDKYILDYKQDVTATQDVIHIVIIDNMELCVNTNHVIKNYPYILEKYKNLVCLKTYIVYSYPKYSYIETNASRFYQDFNSITYTNKILYKTVNNDNYLELFNVCNSILEGIPNINNYIIDIVMFTDKSSMLSDICIGTINKILDTYTQCAMYSITVRDIYYYNNDFPSKVNRYSYSNHISQEIFIKNIINNAVFLSKDINKKVLTDIKLDNGLVFGSQSDSINIINYLPIIIEISGELTITVNNLPVELNIVDNYGYDKLLNAIDNSINYMISNINTSNYMNIYNVYEQMKVMLSDTIYLNIDTNLKHKVQYLQYKLKSNLTVIKNEMVNQCTDDIFHRYAKKICADKSHVNSVNSTNNKKIKMMNERFIKNYNNYNISEKLNTVYNSDNMVNFISNYNNSDNKLFNRSVDFFSSSITLSSWFDELTEKGAIGLLIKVSSSNMGKMGLYQNVQINNITTTFYPIIDFINQSMQYFDDNKYFKFGDINHKSIVFGNAIGDGNTVIPLYINKYHWLLAQHYMKPMLGITFSHDPFGYTKGHIHCLFGVFIEATKQITNSSIIKSEKWVNTFIALFRTCAEVAFENKYNYGIKKYMDLYFQNPERRLFNNISDWTTILCQNLCTGYFLDDNTMASFIRYLIEDSIRNILNIAGYFNDINHYIENNDTIIIKSCMSYINNTNILKNTIHTLISYYYANKMLQSIVKEVGSYSNFLRVLEDNFGTIPYNLSLLCLEICKDINITNYDLKTLYDIIGVEYKSDEPLFYILQGLGYYKRKNAIYRIEQNKYIDYQLQESDAIEWLNINYYNLEDIDSVIVPNQVVLYC